MCFKENCKLFFKPIPHMIPEYDSSGKIISVICNGENDKCRKNEAYKIIK